MLNLLIVFVRKMYIYNKSGLFIFQEDQFRGPAIRALCRITDVSRLACFAAFISFISWELKNIFQNIIQVYVGLIRILCVLFRSIIIHTPVV